MATRRRTFRLLDPALQLRLPAVLVGITALYALVLVAVARAGLFVVVEGAVEAQSPHFAELMNAVWGDFLVSAAGLSLGYLGLVTMAAFILGARTAGPVVAIRRHVEALIEGDTASRIRLRRRDDLSELAESLNELALRLEDDAKRPA